VPCHADREQVWDPPEGRKLYSVEQSPALMVYCVVLPGGWRCWWRCWLLWAWFRQSPALLAFGIGCSYKVGIRRHQKAGKRSLMILTVGMCRGTASG